MLPTVENLSFLVIGCGSIGKRHIGNLQALGVADIIAYDPKPERLSEVAGKFGIGTVELLDEGWNSNPGVALIATPTSLHVPLALDAAQRGCHLFIEKPLGDALDDTDELVSEVQARKLTTMVGCNMRFHHGPATIKWLLSQGAIGRLISARLEGGQYLPDWHPWEDYRRGYSANASMGGGAILDGIHEIDCARWLFGEIRQVFCQGGKLSSLEIDTEDTAEILMKVDSGFSVSVHLDYIQRMYCRNYKVIGEEGTINWDINQGGVNLFSASDKKWHSYPVPADYDVNQMYLDEMGHFLSCLLGEEEPNLPIPEARRVLEIALAIKDSMRSGEIRETVPAAASIQQ